MNRLAALEEAARAAPSDAESQFRLAHALQGESRLVEAIEYYRRVLEIEPDVPEVYNNLGNALRDLGRIEEAVVSYRRALELRPDFAAAHDNLGIALRRAGRFEEALQSHRAALALHPKFAEARSNEGNALRDLGRFEDALKSYQDALKIRADLPQVHTNLGNALRDLGRLEEALASHQRALECRSDLAEVHLNLGNTLLDLLRLDEAAACYCRAVQLRPNYARGLTGLARVLRQKGQAETALSSGRRAVESEPECAESLAFLGELQADQGRFEEAQVLLRRAIEIDPQLPAAWCGLSRCRRMRPDDLEWLQGARRLAQSSLPIRDEISLRYALGKCCNDLGEFEEAFTHYRRANELTRRYGAKYDRAAYSGEVDRIIELYSEEHLAKLRSHGVPSERPVLIVGMPRSGTTLTEQILASHPAVFGAGELVFWSEAVAAGAAGERSGAAVGAQVRQLAHRYLTHLKSLSTDALRVADKMPMNYMHLGLIHAALPRARIIHIRRNPIDNCLSIYFQNFSIAHAYATDLEDLAHFYAQYQRLMDHWRRVLPAETLFEMRYENLVEAQEFWSRAMVEYCGIAWDERCLDFHDTPRAVITPSRWQVRQKIDRSAVGRWRNYECFMGPLRDLLQSD